MAKRNGQRRRYRILIVNPGSQLTELDPWPGDTVWDGSLGLLGVIGPDGMLHAAPTQPVLN